MTATRATTSFVPFESWLSSPASKIVVVLAGTGLLTLSAKLSVPFYPVPMTFQSLLVLLMGAFLGPRLAAATVVAYLAEGAAGLPVFAGTPEKGIGLAYMVGPTGGFLLGFAFAAYIVGVLARNGSGRTILGAAGIMLAGSMAIYLPGLLWLGASLGWDKPILAWGLLPFVLGDLLKLCIATSALLLAARAAR